MLEATLPPDLLDALGARATAQLRERGPSMVPEGKAPDDRWLEEAIGRLGLTLFPALAAFERTFGGLEFPQPEYDDPTAVVALGVRALLGDGAFDPRWRWPRDTPPTELRRDGGAPLVPCASEPEATYFLEEDGAVIGYYPEREELVRMADSAVVFLRRQLHRWSDPCGWAHSAEGEHGAAWAAALGFTRDDALSDSCEQWWRGTDAVIQQLTRDGVAIWRPARYDQGFDGRRAILWAVSERQLEVLRPRLG